MSAPRITPRRILLQVIGFALGVALLIWCVRGAVAEADWTPVRHADPRLVAALLGATAVSLVVNAAIFWNVLRPVHRHSIWRLTLLNGIAGLFNYAPVRIGLVARIAYNLRVDRLRPGLLAAWLLVVGGHMMLALLVVGAAALAAPIGLLSPLLIVGQLGVAKLILHAGLALPPGRAVASRMESLEPMLLGRAPYWGTEGLRMIDIGAFIARMWVSARILGLSLPVNDVVVLAVTAQLVSLSPLGRLGFREAAVAIIASRLESGMGATGVDATFKQLALVESAGEALVAVALGLVATPWYWRAMNRSGAPTPVTPATAPQA